MSERLNELAEIVLDRVYTYGYQQRAVEEEKCKADDDLLAAQRKLADVTAFGDKVIAERDKLSAEIETLQQEVEAGEEALRILAKDRDHWRESRQQAMEAGELMQAEIETLRGQLAVAEREASEEFVERQVLQHEASDDYVELERLRAFVREVRIANRAASWYELETALGELDAANTAPASETAGGAE